MPATKGENVSASVRYHVSDFLSDRLPYKLEDGFAAMRLRDKGKVFDAAAPFNIPQWLECLETCAQDASEVNSVNEEHVKAMEYICAYSISQEAKLCLLHHCIIQRLVALLDRLEFLHTHCTFTTQKSVANRILQLELLIMSCFNSFAAITQGSVELVQFAAATATICVLYRLYGVEQRQEEQEHNKMIDDNKKGKEIKQQTPEEKEEQEQQQHYKEDAIEKIKIAALQLLCSLSSSMIGRQCLLRGHDNEANSAKVHFTVTHSITADNIEHVSNNVNVAEYKTMKAIQNDMPAQLVHCVCCILQSELHTEELFFAFSGVAMHAMELVSYLSIEKEGIEAILRNKEFVVILKECLLRVVSIISSLESSTIKVTKGEYEQFAANMFSVIWNVSMDAQGVMILEEHHFADILFVIFDTIVCNNSNNESSINDNCNVNVNNDSKENDSIAVASNLQKYVSFHVQRHLLGALCALHKLTSVKLTSLKTCNDANTSSHNRLENFLLYLSQLNILVDWNKTKSTAANKNSNNYCSQATTCTLQEIRKSNIVNYDDLVAICKNTVQCIRFASEVESIRVYMHNYLKWLKTTSPVNAFYLRRQLYFATKWQDEFDANV